MLLLKVVSRNSVRVVGPGSTASEERWNWLELWCLPWCLLLMSTLPCDPLTGPGSWPPYCIMDSLKNFPVGVNGNAVICDQGSLGSKMLWDASYSERHCSLTEGWGLRICSAHRPGNFFHICSSSEFVMRRTYPRGMLSDRMTDDLTLLPFCLELVTYISWHTVQP